MATLSFSVAPSMQHFWGHPFAKSRNISQGSTVGDYYPHISYAHFYFCFPNNTARQCLSVSRLSSSLHVMEQQHTNFKRK